MDPPPPPPASSGHRRTLADLDADSLSHCSSFLSPRDVAALALTCKPLRDAAYSDNVWRRLFTKYWPYLRLPAGDSGARAAYRARHDDLHRLKFMDPVVRVISTSPLPPSHLMLHKNNLFSAQGSVVYAMKLHSSDATISSYETLSAHSARITCMRLFPIAETSLFRSEMQDDEDVLITSSADRSIRLWLKGQPKRTFKGHNRPVTTLADKLLGDVGSKLLASGGEDCTIRLWSVSSNRKSHPLVATYHGHGKPISLLSVASHKASLLVSVSTDSRIRVWDTMSSSQSTSSSCVGKACLSGPPVGMKCDGELCYVAAGSSVTAIDLRTMRKVSTVAVDRPKIYSFEMLPSKWLICTGGEDNAMLWDIRKNEEQPEPVAKLGVGIGRVTMLHMDPYKVVTGAPFRHFVSVWETGTGLLTNSLDCRPLDESWYIFGLSAMAVDGCRVVTSGFTEEQGGMYYRDFSNCIDPIPPPDFVPDTDSSSGSKFWESSLC